MIRFLWLGSWVSDAALAALYWCAVLGYSVALPREFEALIVFEMIGLGMSRLIYRSRTWFDRVFAWTYVLGWCLGLFVTAWQLGALVLFLGCLATRFFATMRMYREKPTDGELKFEPWALGASIAVGFLWRPLDLIGGADSPLLVGGALYFTLLGLRELYGLGASLRRRLDGSARGNAGSEMTTGGR